MQHLKRQELLNNEIKLKTFKMISAIVINHPHLHVQCKYIYIYFFYLKDNLPLNEFVLNGFIMRTLCENKQKKNCYMKKSKCIKLF